MKDFNNLDSTHVETTMRWVQENRNIRGVRLMQKKKRRKQAILSAMTWLTGTITTLGCMAWFGVGIIAKAVILIALTCFCILGIGRDEE